MRLIAIGFFLVLATSPIAGEAQQPRLTLAEKRQLDTEARQLLNESFKQFQAGKAAEALELIQKELKIRRQLHGDGPHPYLANSLNSVGFLLQQTGQASKGLPYLEQSLKMRQKLYPALLYWTGHVSLAESLNNVGMALESLGKAEKAVTFYEQSLNMNRKLYPAARYPQGHSSVARSLNNLGGALLAMGQMEQALVNYQESLDILRKLYPAEKYPDGHPELATSLNNVGGLLSDMGQTAKALYLYEQALVMRRKLFPADKYPDGHPLLAFSLVNVGDARRAIGQTAEAMTFYEQSLEMSRQLYPSEKYPAGHPALARSIANMGRQFQAMGQNEKAVICFRESLAMSRQLYPATQFSDEHPELSAAMNNLGLVLKEMGQPEEAITYLQQGLEMNRRLYPVTKYPDGHSDVARNLCSLGNVLPQVGQKAMAITLMLQSLTMYQQILRRELLTASEAEALDRIAAQPPVRDLVLSLTRSPSRSAGEDYLAIAASGSIVTRLLEQRHASARAAGTEVGSQLDELRGLRRRLDKALHDRRLEPEDRDRLLIELTDQRDQLEREVVKAIPALKRWKELDKLDPGDLTRALPPNAVYIDIIRYKCVTFDRQPEAEDALNYVAFVLTKDRPIQRVELEEAEPIDAAITSWRAAIETRRTDPGAAVLTTRIWDKLAPHLPQGTKTLYLSLEGDLARLPWAAIPIGNDRVLLEDFAIAQVPHGTFLLDHLKFPRKNTGPDSLLTLGDVGYGSGSWPPLPGTAVEVRTIATLAPALRDSLSKSDATAAHLTERLPQARFAHIATHGEFQAEALAATRKRAAEALAARELGDESRSVAGKNPLAFVGLVLANGEIMSGLAIVDLPLQNLRLATLSACETGLGEFTGGEGVQGLQRAFHLAGCPNVVASLWNVHDAATASLMARFYHELWGNRKPPIEALREAQLMIYYHPELIPDLAGERGAPRLKEAVEVTLRKPGPTSPATDFADTKLWAAFVLSGVGK